MGRGFQARSRSPALPREPRQHCPSLPPFLPPDDPGSIRTRPVTGPPSPPPNPHRPRIFFEDRVIPREGFWWWAGGRTTSTWVWYGFEEELFFNLPPLYGLLDQYEE